MRAHDPWASVRAMTVPFARTRLRLPRWVIVTGVVLFMTVWVLGMTAGLTAGGCRNDRLRDSTQLACCTISITAGAPFRLFPIENARGAPLFLHRGILRADAGQEAAARRDFARALRAAAGAGSFAFPRDLAQPRLAGLFAAMQRQPADSPALAVWTETVRDIACGHPGTESPALCDPA